VLDRIAPARLLVCLGAGLVQIEHLVRRHGQCHLDNDPLDLRRHLGGALVALAGILGQRF
jgi:hypothetical protein